MKQELVIITNCTYPIPEATGVIGLRFSEHLREMFHIRMIALQEGNVSASGTIYKGIELYTLSNLRWKLFYVTKEKIASTHGIVKLVYKYTNLFLRCVGKIDSLFFHLDNRWFYRDKAYDLLCRMDDEKKIDVVLSISSPIESHLAAERFKAEHPCVRWVSYWGDLLSGQNYQLNVFYSHSRMCNIEKKLLINSDRILTTPEIYNCYSKYLSGTDKNISCLPYILNSKILLSDNSKKMTLGETIRFVYMGSLHPKTRNPKYILSLFNRMKMDVILDLYTDGCNEMVENYAEKSNKKIKSHGKIGYEELQTQLRNAHILINIGNSTSTSVPSKILELMSYRKPIMDFYYPGQQSSLLLKYPHCLEICMDESLEYAEAQIYEFVMKICLESTVDLSFMREQYRENLEENERRILVESVSEIE